MTCGCIKSRGLSKSLGTARPFSVYHRWNCKEQKRGCKGISHVSKILHPSSATCLCSLKFTPLLCDDTEEPFIEEELQMIHEVPEQDKFSASLLVAHYTVPVIKFIPLILPYVVQCTACPNNMNSTVLGTLGSKWVCRKCHLSFSPPNAHSIMTLQLLSG